MNSICALHTLTLNTYMATPNLMKRRLQAAAAPRHGAALVFVSVFLLLLYGLTPAFAIKNCQRRRSRRICAELHLRASGRVRPLRHRPGRSFLCTALRLHRPIPTQAFPPQFNYPHVLLVPRVAYIGPVLGKSRGLH